MAENFYTLPTRGTRFCITSLFGVIDGAHATPHNGDDWTTFDTPDIMPVCDYQEVVKRVENDKDRGAYIITKDPDGVYWYYQHMVLGSIQVHVGQVLRLDTVIGTMGSTGYSTGVHLHIGCRLELNGKDVNPNLFMPVPSKLGCYNSVDYLRGKTLTNQTEVVTMKKKIRIFRPLGFQQSFEALTGQDIVDMLNGDMIFERVTDDSMQLYTAIIAKEVETTEEVQSILNTVESGCIAKVDKP